jgi:S-adenosylmethionine:tRNA ribosyltransferase-isomerase
MTAAQQQIKISDFYYDLPQDFIAQQPLNKRDESKFLIYRDGEILHKNFSDITSELPSDALLVFNNTKVIPARLFVTKSTGALIQIFLLSPVLPFSDVERALKAQNHSSSWTCMIGNAKRWKTDEILRVDTGNVWMEFRLVDKESRLVEMAWSKDVAFCDAIDVIGKMPLPPYIKREAQLSDDSRYQTVYAKQDGAVAAPTAGLHFTKEVLTKLKNNGVRTAELTLHVGAGTFKPVDEEFVWNHPMHEEYYQVDKNTVQELTTDRPIIATGTTSLRTLETLFWVGLQLRDGILNPLNVSQHTPYLYTGNRCSYKTALGFILDHMTSNSLNDVVGLSGIMIMPGYEIQSAKGLITNFHLPKSTLLLLIAAMVGGDWKKVYEEAKKNNYRFLSYGDSSLLMK